MAFPINHRYLVRENMTGIIHIAMTFDNGYIAPTIDHMTWCGANVDERNWTLEGKSPNCLFCAAETGYDYNWGLK